MDQTEVEEFIANSFRDGYSIEEIKEVLEEENVDERTLQAAVSNLNQRLKQDDASAQKTQVQDTKNSSAPRNSVRNQRQKTRENKNKQRPVNNQRNKTNDLSGNSSRGQRDTISGVKLSDDSYTIKQRFFVNRYHVYDPRGNMALKAKQKLFKLKENFPLMNAEGETVARVKGESVIDAGGDYTLKDEENDNPLAVLDRKYTLFRHKWKIRDPKTEEKWADVESADKTIELLRWLGNIIPYFPNVFGLIPHTYELKDQEGNVMASLDGQFSIRDEYELNINRTGDIPQETLIASAVAIDALEGN